MGFFNDVLGVVGDVVGAVIGGPVGAITSVVSGLLGGGDDKQAAVPVMVGGEMGSLSAVSDITALGVPAAKTSTSTGLSTITSAISTGVGIYGQLAQIEAAKDMTEAQKILAQTKLMEAEALKIYVAAPAAPAAVPRTAIPTLSQQPVYVTPVAAQAGPNYLLYIGLAILAFLLLGKKIK